MVHVILRRRDGHDERDERGGVALISAFSMVVLLVLAGLVVDLGLARDTKAASQNAADAAALAAGAVLYDSAGGVSISRAVTAAQDYAKQNFDVATADWNGCTDADHLAYPAPGVPCISFNNSSKPTLVRVHIPTESVETAFGGFAGVSSVSISTSAEAQVQPGGPGKAPCGLCVLNQTNMSGSGTVSVKNNNIHLNTSAFSGNPKVTTDAQFVTYAVPSTSGSPTLPPRVPGTVPPDPLAHVALPFTNGANATPSKGDFSRSGSGSCALSPGRYGSLSLSGSVTCTMAPGLYTFTGSVSLSGSSRLDATSGVTFYFTCGTPTSIHECGASYPYIEYGGSINLSGTNDVDIIAPKDGSPWDGLAIVYDRGNGSNLDYSGTNQKTLRGSVYAKRSTMNLSGTADSSSMDALVVVNNLNLSGNGTVSLAATAGANVTMPALPGDVVLSR